MAVRAHRTDAIFLSVQRLPAYSVCVRDFRLCLSHFALFAVAPTTIQKDPALSRPRDGDLYNGISIYVGILYVDRRCAVFCRVSLEIRIG